MSNYTNGRNFEYRVRDLLLERGAVHVVRSAGSKGQVDLVAFHRDYAPELVQCKANGIISRKERAALAELAATCNAIPLIAVRDGRSIVLRRPRPDGEVQEAK